MQRVVLAAQLRDLLVVTSSHHMQRVLLAAQLRDLLICDLVLF